MTITVWTVTTDTDNGTKTTAHGTEREAYEELKKRYCNTTADEAVFDQHIVEARFAQLLQWLFLEAQSTDDYFFVQSHTIEVSESAGDPVLDAAYREAATEEYVEEGRIEIDSNAVVSHGEDNGAYVAAWVGVDRDQIPLCACGKRNDDGEGFEGMCGSCADRAEESDASEE